MAKESQRLVLVDAFAILFRAYFAIPSMNAPSGEPTNAVYGFTRILLNVIDELQPNCLAIAFDSAGGNFRDEIYPEYKANRDEPPEDFIPQIGLTQQVVDAMNVPRFEMSGWEADDIIGTLSAQSGPENHLETVIVTGDQDLFQLIDDKHDVKVWIPGMRGKESIMYDEAGVIKKLGVKNTQVIEYKGLAGDSSDNIPGVRGIGPKTAVGILSEYPTIEDLYVAIDKVVADKKEISDKEIKVFADELGLGKAVLKKLLEQRDQAFLSKKLATIAREAPIDLDLSMCILNDYNKVQVRELFQNLGFKSLMHILPDDAFETDVQEALF